MQPLVKTGIGRSASAALTAAALSVLLIASLPLSSQAAARQPATRAYAANDALIARSGPRVAPRTTASTEVLGQVPKPVKRLVSYAMPSMPKPAQSLVPERVAERPMTALEYAATLRAPLGQLRVSSDYGMRLHPLARRERFHHGIDYAAPSGTPIRAAQDGQIKVMSGQKGYGHLVRMSHGHGVETVYGHLLKFMPGLKQGSVVRRGDIIGFVGSTGRSTGPHLHFEVLANGRQMDPLQLTVAFASDRLLSMK